MTLVYFLANLIKVYDQQRENDNAIKEFTKVCNKYLRDKEVVYNESKLSIEAVRKKNSEVIAISKLSSGEIPVSDGPAPIPQTIGPSDRRIPN
jgi:hypothetical protein